MAEESAPYPMRLTQFPSAAPASHSTLYERIAAPPVSAAVVRADQESSTWVSEVAEPTVTPVT